MIANPGTTPPGPHRLVWEEDFDGPVGAAPDNTKFGRVTGGGGWGNNELQTFTNRPKNVQLDGNSCCVLTAHQEIPAYDVGDGFACDYSSAKLQSKSRFSFTYGRIDMKVKAPAGRGLWLALWMLGVDIDSVNWPACGEVDILELLGHEPQRGYFSLHGPTSGGNYGLGINKIFPYRLSDDFHVYSTLWTPGRIQTLVDGQVVAQKTQADMTGSQKWPFDGRAFYLVISLSVGGNFPGPPDGTTVFPASVLVDWVRVYQ